MAYRQYPDADASGLYSEGSAHGLTKALGSGDGPCEHTTSTVGLGLAGRIDVLC